MAAQGEEMDLNPYSTKVRFREGGREGIIDGLTELAVGHG
jgi:hypothetical protein